MTNQELYNNLFNYIDGNIYWKKNGKIANTIKYQKDGYNYAVVHINKKQLKISRVIWTMFNGDPNGDIDHIDHNSLNNNIDNLRIVNADGNAKNRKLFKNNKSGKVGVIFCKINKSKPWGVQIMNSGERYFKSFSTKMEAELHALEKYKEFGFHDNNGL